MNSPRIWQLLLSVSLLVRSLDANPLAGTSSASNGNSNKIDLPHRDFKSTSNFTKTGDWMDIADNYLCAQGTAKAVRDALREYYPDYYYFVLLTPPASGDHYYYAYAYGEHYRKDNLCGVDMLVWRYQYAVSRATCSDAMKAQAQMMIDAAAGHSNDPQTIVDEINESDDIINMRHYIILAWDSDWWSDWSNFGTQICMVHNDQAFYYIYV